MGESIQSLVTNLSIEVKLNEIFVCREEHCTQFPNCSFAQGKDSTNIPLSASLCGLPFQKHGSDKQVSQLQIMRES